MEREDALEWARNGYKITHWSFEEEEYIYYINGKYYFEDDQIVCMDWLGMPEYKWNWQLFF